MKVRDVLERKGRAVETIQASESLAEAIRRFRRSKIRALVVTDQDRMIGMLTIRDVLAQIDRKGAAALEQGVREAMTSEIVSIEPHHTLEHVHQVFASRGINHLPVLEEGLLIGIVTPVDVLMRNVKDLDHQRELLHAYITSAVL